MATVPSSPTWPWRRRRPARRSPLVLEALETRNLLSFSAPFSYQFSRDPAAVAVADFTRHGNQDIVVDTDGRTLTMLAGNGDGTFRNAGSFPATGGGEAVLAAGDFTGNGLPDLAVGNSSGVGILLNNGDGTFRSAGVVPVSPLLTTSIITGDFTGNGRQDLVVTDVFGQAFELLSNGDGTFQSPISLGTFSSLVAGDVTHHGRADLVGSDNRGQSVLLVSNGDGSFQAPVPFAPGVPFAVTDVNGDGIADLVFRTRTGISERLGNGDGTFQDPINLTLSADAGNAILGIGDFNNDGQLDLVILNPAAFGQSHSLSVLLNNGSGSFATAPSYPTAMFDGVVAAGDFNGDGRPDLVVAGFDGQAHILLNNGDGTFHNGNSLSAPGVATSVVVGDFNGDGNNDIAVMTRDAGGTDHSQVELFLGNGDGTFQGPQTFDLGDRTGSIFGRIVKGDFDGDGRLDLAVLFRNNVTNQTFVEALLGNGDGTFHAAAPHLVDPAGTQPSDLAAGDFHHNGRLDLVAVSEGDSNGLGRLLFELPGNGDGTFQDPSVISVPGGPFAVAAADLTGSGNLDVVTADVFTNTVSVLRGHGDGTFDPPVSYPVGVNPTALVVGDFNGDHIPDVAVINNFSSSVSVLRGNGDGTLQPAVSQLVGIDPRSLVAADFNGDGALDLAVANHRSGDVSVLLNQGGGDAPTSAGHDVLFTPGIPEAVYSGQPQRPTVVADAVFAASRQEMLVPPQAVTALADVALVHHIRRDLVEADAPLTDSLEAVG
jgi:hypothetical protein